MSSTQELVLACAAMALLCGVVLLRLLLVRVGEMKARRLGMQDVSTSLQVTAGLSKVQAADNFKNLFEVPVLFYALCALLLATQQASPGMVQAAWIYVGLRWLHSLIQCTYNNVTHRFGVYFISTMWLMGMWAAMCAHILELA
jgi:hypothetical protein